MLSDIEIAQKAEMKPITEIGESIGIPATELENYGHYKAKVSLKFTRELEKKPNGKLILVTAISPTPAGEGKTTTTVGLGQALSQLGKKTMICLREPSLGPCMGIKGGAAGGGYSQVVPMEDINLHFTGDLHAITAAHNLAELLLRRFLFRKNQCCHPPAHAPSTYAIMKWKSIVRACRFLKGDPHVKRYRNCTES